MLLDVTDAFRAMADPTRREILRLLRNGPVSAGVLADQFALGRSTLTAHFNVLKAAGLVTTERRAQTILYRLNQSVVEETLGTLMEILGVGRTSERAIRSRVRNPAS